MVPTPCCWCLVSHTDPWFTQSCGKKQVQWFPKSFHLWPQSGMRLVVPRYKRETSDRMCFREHPCKCICEALTAPVGPNMLHRATNDLSRRPQPVQITFVVPRGYTGSPSPPPAGPRCHPAASGFDFFPKVNDSDVILGCMKWTHISTSPPSYDLSMKLKIKCWISQCMLDFGFLCICYCKLPLLEVTITALRYVSASCGMWYSLKTFHICSRSPDCK